MKISKWLLILIVVAALLVGMAAGTLLMSAQYDHRAEAGVTGEVDETPEADGTAGVEQETEEGTPVVQGTAPFEAGHEAPDAGLQGSGEPVQKVPEAPDPTAAELQLEDLREQLEAVIGELDSKWAVYVEDLTGDCWTECYQNSDAETPMISASVIKLFVMGAVYQQLEDGLLEESESLNTDLNWMITISDNSATNRLIALLGGGDAAAGMELVNQWAAGIGCEHTELNRLMLEDNGLQNYTTVRDCGLLLGLIYRGECISPERSAQMLDLLCAQQVTHKIPAGISPAAERVGNKTGELPGLAENDVAIVLGNGEDYLLCVMANDPYSNSAAVEVIRQLSGLASEALLGGQ